MGVQFWRRSDMEANVKDIDKWLRDSGMAESRLGLLACANARAIERIRNGSASIDTLNKVIAYIRKNPPRRKK
jgi:hypothetical protein